MASGGIPSAGYWMGPAMVPLWAPGWGVAALAPLAADEVEAESGADDAHAAVTRIASVASPYSQPAGSSGRDAGSDLIFLARWLNARMVEPVTAGASPLRRPSRRVRRIWRARLAGSWARAVTMTSAARLCRPRSPPAGGSRRRSRSRRRPSGQPAGPRQPPPGRRGP